MAYDLENRLVVGVSSRALFDMTIENEIFETHGLEAYTNYQVEHENDVMKPGTGYGLVRALLDINKLPGHEGRVEVIVMSRNSPETSLRMFNSINHYGLGITRAVLSSGGVLAPYLNAFKTDLFLSKINSPSLRQDFLAVNLSPKSAQPKSKRKINQQKHSITKKKELVLLQVPFFAPPFG